MSQVSENVHAALAATVGEPPEVQAAAVTGAASVPQMPLPDHASAGWLWRVLVVGLVAILTVSLVGILWTVVDGNTQTSPDVIVTIFSSTLAGLIGLFVRSPSQ